MRELPPFARFRQRSRLYAGRTLRTVAGQGLRHPCVFMHVPKCGGTSVSEALYATVPLHLKIGILDAPSIRRALAIARREMASHPRPAAGPVTGPVTGMEKSA